MATWAEFEAAAPDVAAAGRRLLYRDGRGQAMLATVRGEQEPPRMNPITLAIVDGRIFAFVLKSPKLGDLERDGRYALHSHHDPAAPSEFALRGRARLVADAGVRAAAAAAWDFEVDDTYRLFEFSIESALVGLRPTADDWPPKYTSWRSTAANSRR
jgi:hypothetical protein